MSGPMNRSTYLRRRSANWRDSETMELLTEFATLRSGKKRKGRSTLYQLYERLYGNMVSSGGNQSGTGMYNRYSSVPNRSISQIRVKLDNLKAVYREKKAKNITDWPYYDVCDALWGVGGDENDHVELLTPHAELIRSGPHLGLQTIPGRPSLLAPHLTASSRSAFINSNPVHFHSPPTSASIAEQDEMIKHVLYGRNEMQDAESANQEQLPDSQVITAGFSRSGSSAQIAHRDLQKPPVEHPASVLQPTTGASTVLPAVTQSHGRREEGGVRIQLNAHLARQNEMVRESQPQGHDVGQNTFYTHHTEFETTSENDIATQSASSGSRPLMTSGRLSSSRRKAALPLQTAGSAYVYQVPPVDRLHNVIRHGRTGEGEEGLDGTMRNITNGVSGSVDSAPEVEVKSELSPFYTCGETEETRFSLEAEAGEPHIADNTEEDRSLRTDPAGGTYGMDPSVLRRGQPFSEGVPHKEGRSSHGVPVDYTRPFPLRSVHLPGHSAESRRLGMDGDGRRTASGVATSAMGGEPTAGWMTEATGLLKRLVRLEEVREDRRARERRLQRQHELRMVESLGKIACNFAETLASVITGRKGEQSGSCSRNESRSAQEHEGDSSAVNEGDSSAVNDNGYGSPAPKESCGPTESARDDDRPAESHPEKDGHE